MEGKNHSEQIIPKQFIQTILFNLGTKFWNYQFWQYIVRHVDRVSMHHYGGVDEHALLGKLNIESILNLLQQPQILTESYSIIM